MTDPVPWPAARVESVALELLKKDARNSRTHSKAQVGQLAALMREFGWTTAVLRDENGSLLAGHGRVLAAELLVSEGLEQFRQAPVMTATGWSEGQKRAYIIADNKVALNSGWDSAILASELQTLSASGLDMDVLGFGQVELRKVMGALPQGPGDPNAAPPLPILPTTSVGDVWKLGAHRLMCGDSTVAAHVAELLGGKKPAMILTDPPYCSGGFQEAGRAAGSIGARQVNKGRTHAGGIANDKLSTRGYLALMKGVLGVAAVDVLYAFTDWRMWTSLYDVAESSGFGVKSMVVWDKGQPGMGRGWRTQHELVLFGARTPLPFDPAAARGNVITCKRSGNLLHPTQKPVELLAQILVTTSMCPTVYDPFVGSGSTLVACQQEGRDFFGMELSPAYVDVTVRRWQELTGKEATRLADGVTFDAAGAKLREEAQNDQAWA